MYIHLGNDVVICSSNVIAILNIDDHISAELKDVMEIAELDKKLINISEKDKKKSMIICNDYVYISPISSTTLYKRAIYDYKEV